MREKVRLHITSFRFAIGGEHFYGKFSVHVKGVVKTNPDGTKSKTYTSGYGVDYHKHNDFVLERAIDQKEADYLNKKDGNDPEFFWLEQGSITNRFNAKQDVVDRAVEIFPSLFDVSSDILIVGEDVFDVERSAPLLGPDDILLRWEASKDRYGLLEEFGYD
ncbi:MAG: hypothetical protein COB78_10705 [Hyphomicrobiales bacterium]|nr:MAG: hypothetical protein COB78_10705 [Hyphomicrobiales bacterium]